MTELKITEIQSFCLHDGPGIRTTVFLAGCPLSCTWCHNPETQSAERTLVFDEKKCIGCGLCAACPRGVHGFDGAHTINRSRCARCGACVKECPTGALTFSVRTLTKKAFDRLVETQKKNAPDGGITFSGGEPLLQTDAVLAYLAGTDVHTAIETSGYAPEAVFCRMLERIDFVFFDLKLAADDLHRRCTGVSNEPILRNLALLRQSGKPFRLRTPLIPGVTDTEENLSALEKIAGGDDWEKLPFNPLTASKYERIGRTYRLEPLE